MLEVKNLSLFTYNQISFVLRPAEILCVLGPNGCGKTTFLKMIICEINAKNGLIIWNEKLLNEIPIKERSQVISYLPAENEEIVGFSAFEVVKFGRFSRPTKHSDEEILKSFEKFKCLHLKDKKFESLSSGEKRRVLLARLDYQDAQVFILDEPTSYLDFKTKNIFFYWVKQQQNKNKIIIFTSHHWNDSLEISTFALLFKNEESSNNEIVFSKAQEIKSQLT